MNQIIRLKAWVLIVSMLTTSSCTGTASYIRRESKICLPSKTFQIYSNCIETFLQASKQPESRQLSVSLKQLRMLVSIGKIDPQNATNWVEQQLDAWWYKESDTLISGLVIISACVLTISAIAMLSKGGGDGGTSDYYKDDRGCCSYHHGIEMCGNLGRYVCKDSWISSCLCKKF